MCAAVLEIMEQEFKRTPVVVVYKKSVRSATHYMTVTTQSLDVVIDLKKKKPIIDHKYEMIEVGVGESFIKIWMKKFKIKKFDFVE
jgi:trehalose-6-phosphatase